MTPFRKAGELGFLVYFRWDREARRGDVLKVFRDTDFRLHVLANGREVFTRQDAEPLALKDLKLSLDVEGANGVLGLGGAKIP